MSFVTRFAPSPTGPLHLGHAYSALLAHDMARAAGGQFLLRFEDTDLERSKPEYTAQVIDDLTWLGITWDAEPLMQSDHFETYNQSVEQLIAQGLTYPCRCSRKDIAAALAAPQEGVPHPVYPQICKHRSMTERGPTDALRLHMDRAWDAIAGMDLSFTELGPLNKGTYRLDKTTLTQTVGDIVIGRKDIQTAAYFLASALDDINQGITHVVRGVDLFEFTQVQVLLLALLGHRPPLYYHHKLIRDDTGKRLAKRDDARAISLYRSEGASPQDIREIIGL
ncbi:tRNA glutamyl-Q(34) synthetase GluQRS [Sulfitobacter sp. HGT1]|uniref:tRNA glutamyl-Q(34) synthetase GluQRS n=1 Tax=unclassified Sulfitobacter TaxID=196795 RepID=UPI00159343C9|nr:tRNA glutamyl-Q(34) synthetase GluQRS [Sulfitobacter sp. HGT1]MBQ0806187.1 tRNA glutamyl-Q(34) synthetase GluQRS [Sulfitobacter sp.]